MASDVPGTASHTPISRRTLITGVGLAAGAAVIAPRLARAQGGPMAPPSTVTTPPRDFGPNGAPTTYFTDPDVLSVDPMFDEHWPSPTAPSSGSGPAPCGRRGRRGAPRGATSSGATSRTTGSSAGWRTTASVSVFRMPSNNSNGNTFDFQGRQLSCEHLTRRVVRYENDGSITVLADSFEGKRLNSPNDVVPHPDGSYWFTDPPYGGQLYEGAPDAAGGPSNPARPAQEPARPGRGDRRGEAGAADQVLPDRSERAGRPRRHRGPGPRPERALLLPGLQEALRRQHREGAGRHRAGRQGRHVRRSTSAATTSCPTRSSSPTS